MDYDPFTIDGGIVNDTWATRAAKVNLNPIRYLVRNTTAFFVVKVFLFVLVAGGLVFVLWSKILGVLFFSLALIIALSLQRTVSLRRMEFQDALLCPGIVIAESPPTVLVLANLGCGGTDEPVWAVTAEECRSVKPFRNTVGTRMPCVVAFQGDGDGGSWDRMVSNPLVLGTGDRTVLSEALSRLDDEAEWKVLEGAIERRRFPEFLKTLRL